MNQLGPWAILQAIDLLLGKYNHDGDGESRDGAFAWGSPQRFSIGRIRDDQRLSQRGRIDVITLGARPPRGRQTGARQRV